MGCKGIHEIDREILKIRYIAGRDRQVMNNRRRRDHGILDEPIRLPVLKPRPLSKNHPIHRQHAIGHNNQIEPIFNLFCSPPILFPGDLNPGLNLADGYGRDKKLVPGHIREPLHDRPVRLSTPELRDNIGIEQVQRSTP